VAIQVNQAIQEHLAILAKVDIQAILESVDIPE
jgi:hypothetical protein